MQQGVISMKIIYSIIFTLFGLAILGLIFIYSGLFNVGAMHQDTGITKWVLNTTRDNSVDSRIKDIKVPELEDTTMLKIGFTHYKEMCQSCHGAPGEEETELAKGLNPPAPNLAKYGDKIPPREIFWVTKNGIRMTGMPAWGKTHSDKKIWAMVAAIRELPQTSPSKYNSYAEIPDDDNPNKK